MYPKSNPTMVIMCAVSYSNCRRKLAGHHSVMNSTFLRNLFNSSPSYFSLGLSCLDKLVGEYNKVYLVYKKLDRGLVKITLTVIKVESSCSEGLSLFCTQGRISCE